ncbi:MAG: amidohydrolase [Chloroflexi bacterium]|nr:MAG: amidohydrolase [Chloroflexota bacterium]
MRIDAHIHYMPPEIAANLADFTRREPYWGLLTGPNSVQGWASAEQMIDDMDAAGLDRVVVVGEYFRRHESCVARNTQAIELTRRWPERIIALATLQPNAGPRALDELRRCVDGGLRGVGELNPYAQGFSLAGADFLRLAEACARAGLPLNLHTNEEVGPYYPGKSATPLRHLYALACRFPELKLILAHWGGGLLFYEMMPRVRRRLKNVWYDTAASPLLYSTRKIFPAALHAVDHRKILYGSDYPLRLYPKKQRQPDFRPFLAAIERLELEADVARDILGRNAARLFGLLPDDRPAPAPPDIEPVAPPAALAGSLPVSRVAQTWPETQVVFEQFGIPWQDSPVPDWEPVAQAAAARGLSPETLLNALNRAIDSKPN